MVTDLTAAVASGLVTRRAGELGVSYRAESSNDRTFLADLYASTRAVEMAVVPWTDEQRQEFLAMQFNAQHAHYLEHYPDAERLIIEHAGKAVGRLYLDRWPSQHRIVDIALVTQARGRGIGTAILKDLMQEAAGDAKSLSIHVEKNNPAMTLYRRLGFATIEDKGVYDLMEWRDPNSV